MIADEEKCDNTSQQEENLGNSGAEEVRETAAADEAEKASKEQKEPEKSTEEKKDSEKKAAEPTMEEKMAELQDKYLRTLAEYDNYRKRMARELQSTREYAKRSTLADIVGVYDLLQMAVDSSASAKDMAALQAGLKMTFGEFQRTLKQLGVEPINATGQKFDPSVHEAIQMQPSDTVPEGMVIQQWKTGFKMDGSLLRAAVVLVSSGPAKPAEPEAKKEEPATAVEDSGAADADEGDGAPSQEA